MHVTGECATPNSNRIPDGTRSSPLSDNPDMYELHSEDPGLELTPGRYALVLKNQSYDFSVEGQPVDSKQCIERIVASNGTYYSDCKSP